MNVYYNKTKAVNYPHGIMIAANTLDEAKSTFKMGKQLDVIKFQYDDNDWEQVENMSYDYDVPTIILEY